MSKGKANEKMIKKLLDSIETLAKTQDLLTKNQLMLMNALKDMAIEVGLISGRMRAKKEDMH